MPVLDLEGKSVAKDAAAGVRLSAPGSKEILVLDLGASRAVLRCGYGFVCCPA